MKALFIVTLLGFNFAQADSECPYLAGIYVCKDKEKVHEMVFKQETVDGVEKYELPLVDGQETVYADDKRHYEGKDYLLAKCVKNKLEVEQWQIEDSGNPIITLLGNYKYSLNKKKNVLEASVMYELTIGGDSKRERGSFRCNRKN